MRAELLQEIRASETFIFRQVRYHENIHVQNNLGKEPIGSSRLTAQSEAL